MAPELGWWPMSPWLSPGAASFILFNLLVGAIALMSSSSRGPEPAARRRLVRTASTVVLESLRSVSNFPFHSLGDYGVACSAPAASQLHHVQDQYNGTFQGQEAREASRVEHEPASVAQEETVAAAATTTSPQSAPFAAPAAQEVDRMVEHEPASVPQEETAVSATTTTKPQSAARAALDASAAASKAEVGDGESISLDEAYALARAGRQRQSAADTVPRKVKGRGAYGCGRGTEDVEGKAEVDARAEQFIRQFREELKLERINSILNYTHALRRTAGAR
ncbi:uncharacterized protein LOC123410057 [Hordeum vulgare subsp. vulgare]|uniref:DUF4408 domain-containing protein n=1 Tax=Hordeum vulgare subsp. vulgare TaxID=112509 RepID=A0A8I6YTA4_HORVV|nr:uncharacterized protein LOC123410057 [Hordeum vulgare subsp. vulgare]KAI4976187.1 hypothetical protein ZWY2020_049794 [Hordeum vulgare]